MHGNYAPNLLTNECDVLIAVGMRFDDRVTGDVSRYAKQAKVIHIDIDASELNKIIPATVAVHADASQALEILFDLVNENQHGRWLQQFRDLEAVEQAEVIEAAVFPDAEKLNMARVVNELSAWNQQYQDLIVVTDVGQHQMITSRYFSYLKVTHQHYFRRFGNHGICFACCYWSQFGASG